MTDSYDMNATNSQLDATENSPRIRPSPSRGNAMKTTSLNSAHKALGARMVDFAGFEMPIQYSSIVEEHRAVREAAGLFDLQHMGRLLISGPDRVAFLDGLVTNELVGLGTGAARYALMPKEDGGVLDDVIYYIFPRTILLVVNASNRLKILAWLEERRSGFKVQIEDLTEDWAMIAVQGPRSLEIVGPLVDRELDEIKNYRAAGGTVMGIPCLIARTGYTGEIGLELYFDSKRAPRVWDELLSVGQDAGLRPVGLGARDTLRLEAGMPLYGHELGEDINALEAGLDFAVRFDKGDFVGRAAMLAAREQGLKKRLKGFLLEARGVPRQGHEIYLSGGSSPCGVVTSGTHSPSLGKPLCMAFISGVHPEGSSYELDLRGKRAPLAMTTIPFYKRAKAKKARAEKPGS